ncbi:MAG: hypothetical protein HUU02_15955 [Bacteroidetes bacterium]|nr:hypothetical protein [Bacteroidota bacterium]
MLTAAFLVLITIAAMNANKMIVERDISYYEQEAYQQAAVLANSLLTEIMTKDFDEYASSSDSWYANVTDFSTTPNPEWGEASYVNPSGTADRWNPYRSVTTSYFDDVDDYNGYKRIATSGGLPGFELTVQVYYVNSTDLETPSSSRTYYKRIVVTVKNTTYFRKRDQNKDGTEEDVELEFSTVKAY